MLLCRSCNDVRLTRVLDDRGARDPDLPFGGYDTAAPVAEAIAIGGYGDRRVRLYVIRNENIGCTRIVNIRTPMSRSPRSFLRSSISLWELRPGPMTTPLI